MPFPLVSLFLPPYFDVHDRINVGTGIYWGSRVSLRNCQVLSVLQLVRSQVIFICLHETIQIFFIFISYRLGG